MPVSKDYKSSLKKPNLSENALLILESKEKGYLKRNSKGDLIETPTQMFQRVAEKVASAELHYNYSLKETEELAAKFYDCMASLEFLPTTYILRFAGRELRNFFACMVMPLEDDIGAIYNTLKDQAIVQRGGMGVGYDFSKLRPEGDLISTTGKQSSGPVSFMRLFDFSSEVIQNRGSFKHSAHMGVLSIDHPDIYKFLNIKRNHHELTNFNISVSITDEFMKAYRDNKSFALVNPHTHKVTERVSARKLFRDIAESAWACAEPGVVFIDEINRHDQVPALGKIEAVNLCGEQPLHNYETCVLGSINVNNFVKAGKINWTRLEEVCKIAVQFLDNALDISWYLDKRSEEINKACRRIGVGVVGWADLLLQLDIRYGSPESLKLAEKLMKFINDKTFEASQDLGERKGSFKYLNQSIYKGKVKHLRNCARTTIAPTGHLALIAGVNNGIEPYFSFVYERRNMETMGGKTIWIINKSLEAKLKKLNLNHVDILRQIGKAGSLQNINDIPQKLKNIFVTTLDVSPEEQINMQAAFQKYTDNGVSKTVNMPETATVEDIEQVFDQAYRAGCKGITVYRNNSRSEQVLNLSK